MSEIGYFSKIHTPSNRPDGQVFLTSLPPGFFKALDPLPPGFPKQKTPLPSGFSN